MPKNRRFSWIDKQELPPCPACGARPVKCTPTDGERDPWHWLACKNPNCPAKLETPARRFWHEVVAAWVKLVGEYEEKKKEDPNGT